MIPPLICKEEKNKIETKLDLAMLAVDIKHSLRLSMPLFSPVFQYSIKSLHFVLSASPPVLSHILFGRPSLNPHRQHHNLLCRENKFLFSLSLKVAAM